MTTDDAPDEAADGGTITIRKDFGLFMAGVWEQSQRDYQFTVNALLENEQRRRMVAEVTLELVRDRLYELIGGDFAPSTRAIERALNPSYELVNRLVEEGMAKKS